MSSVSVHNLVVTRSGFPAIANSSFDLPAHNCTVVTGENGSGKTTLLKAISGINEIERGEISLVENGVIVSSKSPRDMRRQVLYVGHTPLFMRHITVLEHLSLCVDIDSRIRNTNSDQPSFLLSPLSALEVFRLEKRKNVRVEDLSAGQQQRLHLASAFVQSTPLLCIDEPHASLDEKSKIAFDEQLVEQFNAGRSLIIATHDPKRLEKIVTHKIEIKSGVAMLANSEAQAKSEVAKASN